MNELQWDDSRDVIRMRHFLKDSFRERMTDRKLRLFDRA